MTNEEKLSVALEEFKKKYPSVTSGDIQTFIIGWREAVKNNKDGRVSHLEEVKQPELMPLNEFVFWLNSMTMTELYDTFPLRFHKLNSNDSVNVTVMNMITIDAILWYLVKEHAQKLAIWARNNK